MIAETRHPSSQTALAVVAALVYVALWVGYLAHWGWLNTVDDFFLTPLHQFGLSHQWWVTGWWWFCLIFSPFTFRLLTLILIVMMWRRERRVAVFLLLTVELSAVATEVFKWLVQRPRPSTALVHENGWSFPSGHAFGVMVCVLALLTVGLPRVSPRWRLVLKVLGVLVIIAIGIGRVVLNVHHPSDVLAGWALGYLYYLLCLPVLIRASPTCRSG